jgi:hypothetical protein
MKIILILFIYLISSNITFAEEKKDCSEKKLINKILCKTMGKSKDNKSKLSFKLDTKNIKDKKYLTDWFKKKE